MSLKISRIATLTAAAGVVAAMLFAAAPASASNATLELKNWVVSGYLTPKLLNEPVTLPEGSTFNGTTELEVIELGNFHGTLKGTVTVPPFNAKLKLLGLVPTEVGITFSQVGEAEGTLHSVPHSNCTGPGSKIGIGSQQCALLNVPTKVNVGITFLDASLGLGSLAEVEAGLTTKCETAEPVTFPLETYVTISELITTGPQFSGTATLPPIKCEGLEGLVLGPALTAVMSGPENPYALALGPPKKA